MINEQWNKYTYVCEDCDALIEITTLKDLKEYRGWCSCSSANLLWLSVEDATIRPNNQTKGNTMLDNLEASMEISDYNANVLVTYKDITDGVVTYPKIKVNELEYKLERIKSLEKQLDISNSQIRNILDNMTADGWYNPNTDKSEVLEQLCEILGHEPKQDITIRATVTVDVTYSCPLEDVENFDAKYFLQDELSIDAYNGDIIVESFDVEDADVDW